MQAPSDTAPEPSRLDDHIEACRRMLQALSEKGVELVQALDPKAGPICELALAYSRLTRSVRLNIWLSLRLDKLRDEGLPALAAERAAAAPETDAPDPSESADPPDPRESRERLDREAPDEALRWLKRPMTEAVAAVCADLRLSLDETLEAQAPFQALIANDDDPGDPPAGRTAGVPPAGSVPRPRRALKSRLLAGTAGSRKLGP